MAQSKVQAPFIPGQKEPVGESSGTRMSGSSPKSTSIPGKFISFFGNSGDGKSKGAEATKEDCDAGREKLQGDYYTPVLTDVVAKDSNPKAGAERNDLYSPGAGAGIVASDQPGDQQSSWQTKPPSNAETDEHEQRGEASGTLVSGPGLVEAGKGMATEVSRELSETLVSIRARVMDKLAGLQLPSESLDAVKRTFETGLRGAFTTTKDAVQRTKQGLLDILPSSLSSSSADQARQVVEDMEKDMLANSEGSGEDLAQVSEGPKDRSAAADTPPAFMRAKL